MVRRDCCKVIDQIVSKVPKDRKRFLLKLQEVREDAAYKAPEEIIQWRRLQECLGKFIYPPKQDWEIEIWSIFSTIPVEEIKKDLKNKSNE